LFDECWRSLKPGGRLVANVISLEGEQILDQWQRTAGGQLTRIAVSRGETIGKFRCFKPLMAVTQFCAIKHEIQDGR
jgi:precorrin-6Y C5,15-methyltransferase (decarboxylating)